MVVAVLVANDVADSSDVCKVLLRLPGCSIVIMVPNLVFIF